MRVLNLTTLILTVIFSLAAVSATVAFANWNSWAIALQGLWLEAPVLSLVPVGFLLTAAGAGAGYWVRKRTESRRLFRESQGFAQPNLFARAILRSPPAPLPWWADVTFGRATSNVTISLDVQEANGGVAVSNAWHARNRYLLCHLDRVAKDETVRIELCVRHTEDAVSLWYWARDGWKINPERLVVVTQAFARCRLYAEDASGNSGAYHFFVIGTGGIEQIGEKPTLIGEHFFYEGSRWESDDDYCV